MTLAHNPATAAHVGTGAARPSVMRRPRVRHGWPAVLAVAMAALGGASAGPARAQEALCQTVPLPALQAAWPSSGVWRLERASPMGCRYESARRWQLQVAFHPHLADGGAKAVAANIAAGGFARAPDDPAAVELDAALPQGWAVSTRPGRVPVYEGGRESWLSGHVYLLGERHQGLRARLDKPEAQGAITADEQRALARQAVRWLRAMPDESDADE